mmetsp:Transcript_25882/g.72190  ORF Transcript_25882/g.72190 Transcript_25882/m.72190 type:complete len:315 (-) Transcript_25882:440-1384(-)
MVPRAGILREVVCDQIEEHVPIGPVLQPRVRSDQVRQLALLQHAPDTHPGRHLGALPLIRPVRGHVAAVHEDLRAVLEAQRSDHLVAAHRLAVFGGSRPRAHEHLTPVVKDAPHVHDAVHEVLHLLVPRERARCHRYPGHGQPLPPHLDEVALPLHPSELPKTERVNDQAASSTHGQELPLLVAPNAELPVMDDPADGAGDRVRQAHEPDDYGTFDLVRGRVQELGLAQNVDVLLCCGPKDLPGGRAAAHDNVLAACSRRGRVGIDQSQSARCRRGHCSGASRRRWSNAIRRFGRGRLRCPACWRRRTGKRCDV